MKFEFKAQDFRTIYLAPYDKKVMADVANDILNNHLAMLAVVYGNKNGVWTNQTLSDTHKAILFNVEEINPVKEEKPPYLMAQCDSKVILNGTHDIHNLRAGDTIQIRPIAKKECEHEPFNINKLTCAKEAGGMGEVMLHGFNPVCCKCGAKLKAQWSVE